MHLKKHNFTVGNSIPAVIFIFSHQQNKVLSIHRVRFAEHGVRYPRLLYDSKLDISAYSFIRIIDVHFQAMTKICHYVKVIQSTPSQAV